MQVPTRGWSFYNAEISRAQINKVKTRIITGEEQLMPANILYDSDCCLFGSLINKINYILDHLFYGDAKDAALREIIMIASFETKFQAATTDAEQNIKFQIAMRHYAILKKMLPLELQAQVCPSTEAVKDEQSSTQKAAKLTIQLPQKGSSQAECAIEFEFNFRSEIRTGTMDSSVSQQSSLRTDRQAADTIRQKSSEDSPKSTYGKVAETHGADKTATTSVYKSPPVVQTNLNAPPTVQAPGSSADVLTPELTTDDDEESIIDNGDFLFLNKIRFRGGLKAAQRQLSLMLECWEEARESSLAAVIKVAFDDAVTQYMAFKKMLPQKLREHICPITPADIAEMEKNGRFFLVINCDSEADRIDAERNIELASKVTYQFGREFNDGHVNIDGSDDDDISVDCIDIENYYLSDSESESETAGKT